MNNIRKTKEKKGSAKEKYKLNLRTPKWSLLNFHSKSLNVCIPKICNNFPSFIKLFGNLHVIKSLYKNSNANLCMVQFVKN